MPAEILNRVDWYTVAATVVVIMVIGYVLRKM